MRHTIHNPGGLKKGSHSPLSRKPLSHSPLNHRHLNQHVTRHGGRPC